jgi:TRAP-type C4-dicarboxylate transport system permease small subunit
MDLKQIDKKLAWLSSALSYVGALSLFTMMCLTTVDVVGRYLFNRPITGVFELTEYLVLILIFSFIGYTQSQKSHVAVDILLPLLPQKLRRLTDVANHLVCLALMGLITWMGVGKALELRIVGEASPNLQIPAYPFVFYLVLGCFAMCIELIRSIVHLIFFGKGEELS